jgi:valyl-tRNA synthetase
MATNAASYNPSKKKHHWLSGVACADILLPAVGEETGPVSGKPPALSNEVKAAVKDAASSSLAGSHVPGQDAGGKVETGQAGTSEKKVKSEKECTDIL